MNMLAILPKLAPYDIVCIHNWHVNRNKKWGEAFDWPGNPDISVVALLQREEVLNLYEHYVDNIYEHARSQSPSVAVAKKLRELFDELGAIPS